MKEIKNRFYITMLRVIWSPSNYLLLSILCSLAFSVILQKNIVYAEGLTFGRADLEVGEGENVFEAFQRIRDANNFSDNQTSTLSSPENSDSESNSQSDSDAESPETVPVNEVTINDIINNYSPLNIYNAYNNYMSQHDCKTITGIKTAALSFMDTHFPKDLFAKTPEELKMESAPINIFQALADDQISLKTETERGLYISFRAAIACYNAVNVLGVPVSEVSDNFFSQTAHMIRISYNFPKDEH